MKEKILQLKKEKNAVILAHYYAPDEAQEVADYVGDSFYLAKIAKKSTAEKGTPVATTGAAVISVTDRSALYLREKCKKIKQG